VCKTQLIITFAALPCTAACCNPAPQQVLTYFSGNPVALLMQMKACSDIALAQATPMSAAAATPKEW
jgi:hypothetical protein